MPNTEVKPRCGYNTWVIKPWENSTVPNYTKDPPKGGFLFTLHIDFIGILVIEKASLREALLCGWVKTEDRFADRIPPGFC